MSFGYRVRRFRQHVFATICLVRVRHLGLHRAHVLAIDVVIRNRIDELQDGAAAHGIGGEARRIGLLDFDRIDDRDLERRIAQDRAGADARRCPKTATNESYPLSAALCSQDASAPRPQSTRPWLHESPVGIGTKHVDIVATAAFRARRADFNYSWVW